MMRNLGQMLAHEARCTVNSLLWRAAAMIFWMAAGLALMVAGVLRLGEALGRLCGRWLSDPALGDALAGVVMIAVSLFGMWFMHGRRRR